MQNQDVGGEHFAGSYQCSFDTIFVRRGVFDWRIEWIAGAKADEEKNDDISFTLTPCGGKISLFQA